MENIIDTLNAYLVSQRLDFMLECTKYSTIKKQDLWYEFRTRMSQKYMMRNINEEKDMNYEINKRVELYNTFNRYMRMYHDYDTKRQKLKVEDNNVILQKI